MRNFLMSLICFAIFSWCFLTQLNKNSYHCKDLCNQTERSAWYFTHFTPTQNILFNTTHTKTHTCTTDARHCELFYFSSISNLVIDKYQSELLKHHNSHLMQIQHLNNYPVPCILCCDHGDDSNHVVCK